MIYQIVVSIWHVYLCAICLSELRDNNNVDNCFG